MSRRCPVCQTEFPDEVAFCGHDGNVTIHVQPPGEEPDPRLGEKLGIYIVAAHIADGAMGAVYEARNADTREQVAIKVLHADVEEDEIAVERFRREYETADMFDHPHIVRVIDFGETVDSQHYMTMEYLAGLELGHLIRSEGPQPPARTLRVLAQAAMALEHAHEFGVIHRDLKPDNIFLCKTENGDDVRILDFGSVKLQVETGPKLTAFGTTLGSPYYMSPEQAKGLPDVDTRTDVFAIGAILYEMLSGKIAFEAPTVAEILMKIVRLMPEPIHSVREGLPPGIHGVIEKAIAKKKEERFDTPVALIDAAFAAFGVQGGCEVWADEPEAELAAALASATAPAAVPQAAPVPQAPAAQPVQHQPPGPSFSQPGPPAQHAPPVALAQQQPAGMGGNKSILLLAGVAAAVIALGCVASAILYFVV